VPTEIDLWFQEGVAAAKRNRRQRAYDLLSRVVEHDDQHVLAWLWLSAVADDYLEQACCFENISVARSRFNTDDNRLAWTIATLSMSPIDWDRIQEVVQSQPFLLRDESLDLLANLSMLSEDSVWSSWIDEFRYLLIHCRQVGVAAAFAEKIGREVDHETLLSHTRPTTPRTAGSADSAHRMIALPAGEPVEVPPEYQLVYYIQTLPNTDEAIAAKIKLYRTILDQMNRDEAPAFWKSIKNNLAAYLVYRTEGDRGENLEEAILHFSESLEVATRQDFPADWGTAHYNLANAFLLRVHGDRAANLENAVQHCRRALEVFTRSNFPLRWAATQISLGNLYQSYIGGNRAENMKLAVHHYHQALEVYTRSAFPEQWAVAQINLGQALSDWITGDWAENLEQSIHHCQQALEVFTLEEYPVQWAGSQITLANALLDRVRGDRAQNIELAIHHLNQALRVHTREELPIQWGTVHNNLGLAFTNRLQGDPGDNLKEAIYHLLSALEVRTRRAFPDDWAATQANLANAFSEIGAQEKALASCRSAMQIYTRHDYPADWGRIQYTMGNAYRSQTQDGDFENVTRASDHYRGAIDIFRQLDRTHEESQARQALSELYLTAGMGEEAHAALIEAVGLVETLRAEAIGEIGRKKIAEDSVAIYSGLVQTCLSLVPPQVEEAWEWAEAGKGRFFLDQLGQSDFPLPRDVPQPVLDQESGLMQELRKLRIAIEDAPSQAHRQTLAKAQKQRRQDLEKVWGEIETYKPFGEAYVALRRGDTISFARIKSLVENQKRDVAILGLYHTLAGEVLVFALRRSWDKPHLFRIPLDQEDLLHNYLSSFKREVITYLHHIDYAGRDPSNRWQKLGDLLFAEVMPLLEGVELLYLIPHSAFHHLPLHCLTVNGLPVIERFPVVYAPSTAVLARVQERAEWHTQASVDRIRALVIGYTPNPEERKSFYREAKYVASEFHVKPNLGMAAESTLLQRDGSRSEVIHLSCHGHFDVQSPMASFVRLRDGPFAADQVMKLDLHADLVTLSACETGRIESGLADDPTGLPRAFLYAGASSLLVSMWEVAAPSTRLMMEHFYQKLYSDSGEKRLSKAEALREAILEIRDYRENGQKPFANPYFWAPFILIGDWL
jgi:CHAT domain-containing protein